jgi:hypothetical protein
MAGMSVDSGGLWDAAVDVMLAVGHAREGRSRYGDKPALFAGSREIAHLEQDGAIDLRIRRAGWGAGQTGIRRRSRRTARPWATGLDRAAPQPRIRP